MYGTHTVTMLNRYSFGVTLLICPIVNLGHNFEFQRRYLHSVPAHQLKDLLIFRIFKCTNARIQKHKRLIVIIRIKKSNSLSLEKDRTTRFHSYLLQFIWIVSLIYEFVYFCSSAFVNAEDEKSRNKKLSLPLEEAGKTTCFHS